MISPSFTTLLTNIFAAILNDICFAYKNYGSKSPILKLMWQLFSLIQKNEKILQCEIEIKFSRNISRLLWAGEEHEKSQLSRGKKVLVQLPSA